MAQPKTPAEEPAPFLGSEPPPLVARGLALVLLSLFAVTALLAIVVKIPETVRAGFVLVPRRGTDPVRAPRGGRITEAHVVEGARVTKGRPLFVLRSTGAADRLAELQTAESKERGANEGLANARRKFESETRATEEETKKLVSRVAFLERMRALKTEQLALNEEQANRAARLGEQGLASLDVQADARIRRAQAAMELEQIRTDLREAETAVQKLRLSEETRRAAFREEERALAEQLGEARILIAARRGDAPGGTGGEVAVEAPCDGTVLRLQARGEGAVVAEGATLAEVACSGERLQAELNLPQEALSQIRPGLRANLLYESFPYQRYGVQYATLRWASPAGGEGKDGPTFRGFADLFAQSIRVGGEDRPLLPGMKGTALIVVGRRSVISYAFAPLQQLRESFR